MENLTIYLNLCLFPFSFSHIGFVYFLLHLSLGILSFAAIITLIFTSFTVLLLNGYSSYIVEAIAF